MGDAFISVYCLFDSEIYIFSFLFFSFLSDSCLATKKAWWGPHITRKGVIILDYGVMITWWGCVLSNLRGWVPLCCVLISLQFSLIIFLTLFVSCFPLYDRNATGVQYAAKINIRFFYFYY